jgi:hypothetical protein
MIIDKLAATPIAATHEMVFIIFMKFLFYISLYMLPLCAHRPASTGQARSAPAVHNTTQEREKVQRASWVFIEET